MPVVQSLLTRVLVALSLILFIAYVSATLRLMQVGPVADRITRETLRMPARQGAGGEAGEDRGFPAARRGPYCARGAGRGPPGCACGTAGAGGAAAGGGPAADSTDRGLRAAAPRAGGSWPGSTICCRSGGTARSCCRRWSVRCRPRRTGGSPRTRTGRGSARTGSPRRRRADARDRPWADGRFGNRPGADRRFGSPATASGGSRGSCPADVRTPGPRSPRGRGVRRRRTRRSRSCRSRRRARRGHRGSAACRDRP